MTDENDKTTKEAGELKRQIQKAIIKLYKTGAVCSIKRFAVSYFIVGLYGLYNYPYHHK